MSENTHPTRAVVFDLDGVLISSVDLHWYAFRKALAHEGIEFSRAHYLQVGIGSTRDAVIRAVVGDDIAPEMLQRVMAAKGRYVDEYLEVEGLSAIPGSLEFVRRVLDRKLLTCVATASRTPKPFLAAIGATELFPIVLDRSTTGRPKPYPDIYLRAAAALGVTPQECVVIEDSPVGVQAARAAQMRVLAVTTTHPRSELQAATAVVDTFDQIDLDAWV